MLKKIKTLLICLLITSNISCNAQKELVKYFVIENVDLEPSFPGGKDSLNLYLLNNINWSSIDYSGKGYLGLEFNIERDGTLTNFKIIKSLDVFLDKEVLNVVSKMPNWVPATKNNRSLKTTIKLYIYLKIEGY